MDFGSAGLRVRGTTGRIRRGQARRRLCQRHRRAVDRAARLEYRPGRRGVRADVYLCSFRRVVALVGASPVFVDVLEDTYNMDPASLEAAIALVKREGKLRARAVMPVDLFGQPADYRAIEPIVQREG